MPSADKYVAGLFPVGASKTDVRAKILSPLEAANLSAALRVDASDMYYSGWVSFLDALNGIKSGFCTWATAKLYYTIFYAFRASLALDDVCTFHVSRPHYIVRARQGELPISCAESGTHKAVLKAFQRQNPSHSLLSQQIELKDAVDWLMEKRESANYGDPRFSEPDSRNELQFIAGRGIRQTLNAYLADKSSLYVFDPDHAMVAYPLRTLQSIGVQLATKGVIGGLAQEEQQFLKLHARDGSGSLSMLVAEMKHVKIIS
jgi:hypothetical protein